MKIKLCNICKKWKPLLEFHKEKRTYDGLKTLCKECARIYNQKWSRTHKIKVSKRKRKYYQTIVGCLRGCFYQIVQRCNNPKCKFYKIYGGRGIKCLFKSSQEFVDYVVNELKADPRGLLLDRINNDGNYEPGNIRFVTAKESANNRGRKNESM